MLLHIITGAPLCTDCCLINSGVLARTLVRAQHTSYPIPMAAVPTGAPGGAGDASELDVNPIKSLLDLSLDARAAWQHSEHRAHFAAVMGNALPLKAAANRVAASSSGILDAARKDGQLQKTLLELTFATGGSSQADRHEQAEKAIAKYASNEAEKQLNALIVDARDLILKVSKSSRLCEAYKLCGNRTKLMSRLEAEAKVLHVASDDATR